jgi:catalase
LLGELTNAGAVTRLLGSRLGTVRSVEGKDFEVDATLENSPSVLFDALVLPDGDEAVQALGKDGHSMEFLKDQYRHCKTILALGTSSMLLDQAGIAKELPTGEPDPGLISQASVESAADAQAFIAAMAKHRHPQRDRDPPLV